MTPREPAAQPPGPALQPRAGKLELVVEYAAGGAEGGVDDGGVQERRLVKLGGLVAVPDAGQEVHLHRRRHLLQDRHLGQVAGDVVVA